MLWLFSCCIKHKSKVSCDSQCLQHQQTGYTKHIKQKYATKHSLRKMANNGPWMYESRARKHTIITQSPKKRYTPTPPQRPCPPPSPPGHKMACRQKCLALHHCRMECLAMHISVRVGAASAQGLLQHRHCAATTAPRNCCSNCYAEQSQRQFP